MNTFNITENLSSLLLLDNAYSPKVIEIACELCKLAAAEGYVCHFSQEITYANFYVALLNFFTHFDEDLNETQRTIEKGRILGILQVYAQKQTKVFQLSNGLSMSHDDLCDIATVGLFSEYDY